MQSKPSSWPADAAVEDLPEVFLRLDGSSWPPAGDDTPAGTASLGAWSVNQSLTSSALPGQVRGVSGFSVAQGSAVFAQPEGEPLTPWAPGGRRLSPGGACSLYASHVGAGGGLTLGQFMVAPIAGASISNEVALDLEGRAVRLKRRVDLNWIYDDAAGPLDAAWAISELASAAGYPSVPRPLASGVQLDAPLYGWESATVGKLLSSELGQWSAGDGMIGLGPESFLQYQGVGSGPRTGMHFSCMVAGRGGMVNRGGITADVRPNAAYFRMGSTHFATAPFPNDGALSRTVKISYERTGTQSIKIWHALPGGPLQYDGEFTLPANPGSWAMSDRITVGTNASNGGGGTPTRWIRGLQVHDSQGFAFPNFKPQALIEPAMSPLTGIFDTLGVVAWETMQQIASATMGALWVDEVGRVTYRGRSSMRGSGPYGETVEALDTIESLDWSIDPGDIADRVEMTYTPTTLTRDTFQSILLWESEGSIRVAAKKTNTLDIKLEGVTDRLADFLPIWDERYPEAQRSRWAASTLRDGGGERPSSQALTVTASLTGPGTARLSIRNNTSGTLWLVDAGGNPSLRLRSSVQIIPGEEEAIGTGKSELAAINPLSIGAGQWVQDPITAHSILGWVSGGTEIAQATIDDVRVKPDLGRQLGDVVRLRDAATGLLTKAIITGVTNEGDSSGYSQRLGLALLDLTFEDLGAYLESRGIDTFMKLDQFMQTNQLDTFTKFDVWGHTFGGTL